MNAVGSGLKGALGVLRSGLELFGRVWIQITAVVLVATAAVTGLVVLGLSALSGLASAQRGVLLDDRDELTRRGLVLLLVEVALPMVLIAMCITGVLVVAVAQIGDDALNDRPPSVRRALRRGMRRMPTLLGGLLIGTAAVVGLILLTPLFMIAAVLGLVATPMLRWAGAARRPSIRTLLLLLMPLGPAAAVALRWGLLVPLTSLERNSSTRALRRSQQLVGPGLSPCAITVAVIAVAYLSLSVILDVLKSVVDPWVAAFVLAVVAQVLLVGLPVATVTALFRGLVPRSPDRLVIIDRSPPSRPNVHTMAVVVLFSLVAGLGVLTTAAPAYAAAMTFRTVNDLGDGSDVAPGDGTCEVTAGAGDCSLRAAVDEANASPADITEIGFGVDGSIHLGAPIDVAANVRIDGAGQQVVISGRGCGDCPANTQLLRFAAGVVISVANLALADGVGGPQGGGAIEAPAPGPGSSLVNVTFSSNQSNAPGGAVALLGGTIVMMNVTFHSNTSSASGSDIYNNGALTLLHTTLAGSWGPGGALHNGVAGTIDLLNSIVAPSGGVACTEDVGVSISGSANRDSDGSCPGSLPAGPLGSFGYDGGWVPTVAIGLASLAIDGANPTHCADVGFVDARGVGRPFGDACDIGAYEYTGPIPAVVVAVTTDPAPSDLGAAVTVTATVGAASEVLPGTGTVTFSKDGAVVAVVDLVDGVATYEATGLAVGDHRFEIEFPSDGLLPSGSGSVVHTVLVPATSVDLAVVPATPILVGQSVTLTAIVGAPGVTAAPTGSVTFLDGPAELATVDLVDGTAELVLDSLGVGDHSFRADYNGDASFPAASGDASYRVQSTSSLTLASTAATTVMGEEVTFTATIITDRTATPSGEVTFWVDGIQRASTPIEPAGVTFTTSSLAVGPHSLQAKYAGDDLVLSSESTAIAHDVEKANTSVGVTSSVDPSALGEVVTFTATVTPQAPGRGTPTGTVTFTSGAVVIGTVVLTGDTASVMTPALLRGEHVVSAEYRGDASFNGATGEITQTVGMALTRTVLSSSLNPSRFGDAVILTATVTSASPGSGTPRGMVRFLDGDVEIATRVLSAGGVATLTTPALSVAAHALTAEYLGDADFVASSSTLQQRVSTLGSATQVVPSVTRSVSGQQVTFVATVAGAVAGRGVPTGTMTFRGEGLESPVTVDVDPVTGAASVSIASPLGRGERWFVSASYAGDANFAASSGSADLRVDPAAVAVAISVIPADPVMGQSVTVDVTVTAVAPAVGVPKGAFTITDFGAPIRGPWERVGFLTTEFTTPGDLCRCYHELAVRFSGVGWVTTGSATVPVSVAKVPTTLTLRTDPSPSAFGHTVRLIAELTVPDGTAAPVAQNVIFQDGSTAIGSAIVRRVGTRYQASMNAPPLAIGVHRLVARFDGPDHERAESPVIQHEVLRRITKVLIATNGPTLPDQPVVVDVFVQNIGTGASGTASPTGWIDLLIDGHLVRTSAPVAASGASLAHAQITINLPLRVGSHEITANYRPHGDFLAASASLPHVVEGFETEVTIAVDRTILEWGRTMLVTAYVTPIATTTRRASGTVLISTGDGTTCVVHAPVGTCAMSWDRPAHRLMSANYDGDEYFDPGASTVKVIQVTRRPANITASVEPAQAITEDPATVRWDVLGETGSVTASIAQSTCVGDLIGSCEGRFALSTAGLEQTINISFGGDVLYDPAEWTTAVTPIGCHRLDLRVVPASDGTIAPTTVPNCNAGRGFLAGSLVAIEVKPITDTTPAWDWDGTDWQGDGWSDTRHSDDFRTLLRVGTDRSAGQGTVVRATPRRHFNCFAVVWLASEIIGGAGGAGALRTADTPNCPVEADGSATQSFLWRGDPGRRQGRFLAGSVVRFSADPGPGMEFYGFGEGAAELAIVDRDQAVQGVFGPVCIQLEVLVEGSGQADATTPYGCRNPVTGANGFRVGQVVEIAARADERSYVREWLGADEREGSVAEVWTGSRTGWVAQFTTRVTMREDPAPQQVTARVERCSRVTSSPRQLSPAQGYATRSRNGDCPTSADRDLFKRGGTVDFTQVSIRGAFGRWGISDQPSDAYRFIQVSTDTDVEVRPSFLTLHCSTIEVRIAAGVSTALVDLPLGGDDFCVPGTLGAGPSQRQAGQKVGNAFERFEATATQGDPLLGWVFQRSDGVRYSVPGAKVSADVPVNGGIIAEASACVGLSPEVRFIYPDGSSEIGGANAGFVQLSDPSRHAPNCAFGSNTWQVGSATVLAPLVDADFRFLRWEGDVAAPTGAGNLLPIDFDGSQPVLTVRAVYQVTCYSLELTGSVIASEAPNCQPSSAPAPPGPGGRFVAGTELFLRGTMPGGFVPTNGARATRDHVWTGWGGQVPGNRYLNPLTVTLDQDRSITFTYRETSTWEDIKNVVTDAGTFIAETARKAIAVATTALGEIVMGAGVAGLIGGAIAGLGVVNMLLEAFGVKTGDFGTWAVYAQQTLDWMKSGFTCVAAWGWDDGRSTVYGGAQGGETEDTARSANAFIQGQAASEALVFRDRIRDAERAHTSSLKWEAGNARLSKGVKATQAIGVAINIYDAAEDGAIGWGTDLSAWSNDKLITSCLESYLPDYMGVPPAPPIDE